MRGRNTWLVWTGGDDRFWDQITEPDLRRDRSAEDRLVAPGLPYSRDNRWTYLGLVNEPCFEQGDRARSAAVRAVARPARDPGCAADPFENEAKYPGVAVGARGGRCRSGSYVRLRDAACSGCGCSPTPISTQAAAQAWDPVRYYTDPAYYQRSDLVRPYRVGMSCGFCHVGPNPERPPADPEHPRWENISSLVGAQYFWVDRILAWNADPSNFIVQVLHTVAAGLARHLAGLDRQHQQSAHDERDLPSRRRGSTRRARWGRETLAGGELNNRQFNDFIADPALTQFFQPPDTVFTTHVLKDGADSRRARSARSTASTSISACSARNGCGISTPIIGGAAGDADHDRHGARRTRPIGTRPRLQTPDMAPFLLAASSPHQPARRAGRRAPI